ncbi:uncharacterized protein with ParB-like and HNH nuclease domain [Peribacillus deserti]|uniref:Uncharacterized protein with ParB-like and HNH nuclease domain n=1 Tax=Peribacillus deserti TaxID=673318 RepID=A0ABS2QF97_9BACI|nr:DUF262 domain-containing protein [Peribacillus deserti]MBM7691645.1 uncharacterized protein with ParB-like and HNH nuclease domain [Peribacillus deserti]
MNITSEIKTINDILSENNTYHVTRFQREYAWEKDDLLEFWNDITSSIKVDNGTHSTTDYFIGSIVMINREGSTRFDIVDGQQRLTTISILLSQIIESLKDSDLEFATNTYKTLIEGTDQGGEKTFKIKNENSEEFLNDRILFIDKSDATPNSEEEKKLFNSFEFFRKELVRKKGENEQVFENYLKALIEQIKRLKTIFITVDDEDEAYVIFEILNSKGHDLENIDLIKNLIFKLLTERHPIDRAKTNWKKIKEDLLKRETNLDIDTYFRTYWLSKEGYIPKTKLYQSVKNKITNQHQVLELLSELSSNVELYQKISNPQTNDWTETRQKVIFDCTAALKLFGVYTPRPFILSLLSKYTEGNRVVKIGEVEDILTKIEYFHFIFTAVSSLRASGLDKMYIKFSKKITDSNSITQTREILNELKEILKEKLPSFDEFTNSFKKLHFTNEETKDKKLIQYIFKKWEAYLRQTNELTVNHFTLEHIVPQSTVGNNLGTLGNLLPLDGDLNNKIDRKPFPEKIQLMRDSELHVVQEFISKYEEKLVWEETDIEARTEMMAKTAFEEIWNV